MKRSVRATADIWLARIGTAFGWFWFVLYALVAVVAVCDLFDGKKARESLDYAMPLICAGLAAVHFLLIRVSKRTRVLVGDFRLYAKVLAENKSLTALSAKVKEPKEQVEKKLAEMCKRGYFKGKLDLSGDCLVLDSPDSAYAARCPGCGATTAIYRNGDRCRYCGNPLTVGKN